MDLPISAKIAKSLGIKRFFSGKPCKYGHIAERMAVNGDCTECIKKKKHDFYIKNIERIREYKKNYRAINSERILNKKKKYRQENQEKVYAGQVKWRRENPERVRALGVQTTSKRRAQKKNIGGVFSEKDILSIRTKQKDKCIYCLKKLNGAGEIDHILPLSKGGSNWPENLQITCVNCNRRKSAKLPHVFAQEMGLLI